MAGRELIRELHEASYRRLAIELLAYADDLRAAEAAAREAFAAAYRDRKAVDDAASPYAELRERALEAWRRRAGRDRLRTALSRRRPVTSAVSADPRLSEEATATLRAVVALPEAPRRAVILRYLLEQTREEVASAVSSAPDAVDSLLSSGAAQLQATLGGHSGPTLQRLDDLAIDLRQAIGMPSFDEVVSTASRHRRRMLVSVVAAAALVAGGVFVSVGRSPNSAPADPLADLSRETTAVRAALQEPDTTMYAVARTAGGVWASFWYCRSCAIERSFALLSRDGFLHVEVVPLRTDGQGDAWATATGDFVVSSGVNKVVQVIADDGTVRVVAGAPPAPPRPAGPGDLVVTSYGLGPRRATMVIDPTSARMWPLRVPTFHERASVNFIESYPDGSLWGVHLPGQHSTAGVLHSTDLGRSWSRFLLPLPDPGKNGVIPFSLPLVGASGAIGLLSLPYRPELYVSADGGATWRHRSAARDIAGRRVQVIDAAMSSAGAIVIAGVGADDVPRLYLAARGIDDYRSLRPVLRESVSFTRPPLDRPNALWATAPEAIWESDDGGESWHLLVNHQAWQVVDVVESL